MLLDPLPLLRGSRSELEFRNAGEVHVVRSLANMASESDDDFEKYFFIRSNPKGIIYERWRHIHIARASSTRCATPSPDKFVRTLQGWRAEAARSCCRSCKIMAATHRISGAGRFVCARSSVQLRR